MNETFFRKAACAILPKSWILRRTLPNGAMVAGENRPGHGGRGVYIFGEHLEPELAVLGRFLERGAVFLDIGANVGAFSLKAAKEVGEEGVVVAIEPFPRMASRLLESVIENGFNNVRVRVACASDRLSPASFWMNRGKPNSFSLVKEGDAACFNTLTLPVDWLVETEGLDRLDYVKIDAEGVEAEILKGASRTIERFQPVLQVEILKKEVGELPDGYTRWQAPGSLNHMFFPGGSEHLKTARDPGWSEV